MASSRSCPGTAAEVISKRKSESCRNRVKAVAAIRKHSRADGAGIVGLERAFASRQCASFRTINRRSVIHSALCYSEVVRGRGRMETGLGTWDSHPVMLSVLRSNQVDWVDKEAG